MNSKLPTYSLLRSNPWIKIRSDKGMWSVLFLFLHLSSLPFLTLNGREGSGEEKRQQVLYLTIPIVLIPCGLANNALRDKLNRQYSLSHTPGTLNKPKLFRKRHIVNPTRVNLLVLTHTLTAPLHLLSPTACPPEAHSAPRVCFQCCRPWDLPWAHFCSSHLHFSQSSCLSSISRHQPLPQAQHMALASPGPSKSLQDSCSSLWISSKVKVQLKERERHKTC